MTGIDKPRPIDDFYRHDHNDVLDNSASVYVDEVKNVMNKYLTTNKI